MKITLVPQEDAAGCGVACLATITGKPYQEVYSHFVQNVGMEGLTLQQIIEYAGNAGFSIVHKYITHYATIQFGREEMFTPFAPVHIIRLKQFFDTDFGHLILMDKDGKLLCPAGQSDEEIKESYAVTDVLGLYPLDYFKGFKK